MIEALTFGMLDAKTLTGWGKSLGEALGAELPVNTPSIRYAET
jgi:hypothetical protein